MGRITFICIFILNLTVISEEDYSPKLLKARIPKNQMFLFEHETLNGNLDFFSVVPVKNEFLDVTFRASYKSLDKLNKAKVIYETLFEDADFFSNLTDGRKLHKERSYTRKGGINIPDEPTYEEILDILRILPGHSSPKKKITVTEIGRTIQNRTIVMVKIENPRKRNVVLMDGGIHAREWLAIMTALYVAVTLATSHDSYTDINWYIIPCLNPDGYVYTYSQNRLQRKNMNVNGCPSSCHCGVDLNRNFEYKYGVSGTSSAPCAEQYRGTGPFSEPESRALREIIIKYATNTKAYISLHCYGPLILYPWGYARKPVDDWRDLKKAGEVAARVINRRMKGSDPFQVMSSGKDLYPAAGGSDDYTKSLNIKYSYTIELQPGGRSGFDPTPKQIRKFAEVNYFGIVAMVEYINEKSGKVRRTVRHPPKAVMDGVITLRPQHDLLYILLCTLFYFL